MGAARTLGRPTLIIAGVVGATLAGQVTSLILDGSWVPFPVVLQAFIFGGLNALVAIGIVLVYRASRVINFAQASFGGVAAALFVLLLNLERWSWYAALGAGVGAALFLGVVVEVFLIRRFFRAPRLILTVVTLGVAQVLAFIQLSGLRLAFGLEENDPIPGGRPLSPVSQFDVEWFPVRFIGDHFLVVGFVIVVLVSLTAFLRYTSLGIAIRGAAENDARAAMLGVNVRNLSTLVWVFAALLSALPAILQLPFTGAGAVLQGTGGLGAGLLLRALAAAVLARMESLPVVVAASLGISAFEQSVFWAFGQTSIVDGFILAVIILALLVQRRRLGRAQEEETGTWAATEEVRPIPPELANHPAVRRGVRVLTSVLVVSLLAFPWVMSPSQTNLGSAFVIFGIIAVSLVILTGWGGQISLGQFAFVAVGGVVGGAITSKLGWSFLIAAPIAALVGAAVAVVLGLPALRMIRGLFLAVTTLAFSIATATVLLNERFFGWLLPGTIERPTFFFIDTEDERSFFYFSLVFLLLSVLAVQGLRKTRTGRALIAMRDNERAAQSFGLNLVRVRLATFAISGFLAAVAGILFAHHQHAVSPQAFGPAESIAMFLMAVIGGLGSVSGVLLGAAYIGAVRIFGSDAVQLLASGAGVLLVLMFFPGGLGSLAYRMRDAWLRRVAIRYHVHVPSLLGDRRLVEAVRVPLVPKLSPTGNDIEVPVRYRIRSRIGTAGASQKERAWRF